MRIYIAAPLAQAPAANEAALRLEAHGHEVVSSWHRVVSSEGWQSDPEPDRVRARILSENLADLDGAEAVLALCHEGTPRATFAEIGYALARGLTVVWSHGSERQGRNIFDAHPLVRRVEASELPLALALFDFESEDADTPVQLPTLPGEGA
jgi:nucleoside 2-deoxyribosyltransferase